jgi:hypothetical protein
VIAVTVARIIISLDAAVYDRMYWFSGHISNQRNPADPHRRLQHSNRALAIQLLLTFNSCLF